ncbi:acyl-CoA dehydrogenase family protein [Streptomyces sp. NPDC004538]|uniref:acyl-CoA dehydrogenase family protein n=1 Tax=Streptomyces sp. NPDC004538 TaxID=3154279 RepID=UPI0033BF0BA9
MHEVNERVEELAAQFEQQAVQDDDAGRLTDETAALMRSAGVVRLLQPREFGGYEATPGEFYRTVMALAARNPAAGWVGGVVGIHPWELAFSDPRLQRELWGENGEKADTWISSPYAPNGRARKVDGGFLFSGRWPFGSGSDHCDWAVLGGIVTDDAGNITPPPDMRHFVLPRADYDILEDSWNVVGLAGTGSKDIVVENAFVPDHRTLDAHEVGEGILAERNRPGNPLYAMPFGVMFSSAISAATLGIAEGALAAFLNYTRRRITIVGSRAAEDPHQLTGLGEAAADLDASRTHLLATMDRMYEDVLAGRAISIEARAEARRNQVRASRRATDAVDELFRRAGGGSLRLDQPLQRHWRDVHAAMNHLCNVADSIYEGWSRDQFGLPAGIRVLV